jgi:class 3 adenylate cyclase
MLSAAFVDQDPVTLHELAAGSHHGRMITAGDDWWSASLGSPEHSQLVVARAQEIGITGFEIDILEAHEHGDVGWVAGIVVLDRDAEGPLSQRITAVFMIETGRWRLVQWHQSAAVENLDAYGVELRGDLGALVESLDESSSEIIGAAASRGTVTLMFSDVADSTQLSESMGDAAWSELITRHLNSVSAAVTRHGGTTVKTLGDGAMAAFPSVSDALECAVEIQVHPTDSLQIRVGVHTGDAIHADGDYVGITVNKAARIASAAEPGETLISSATAEMAVSIGLRLGSSRTVELKGLSGTHRLTQILAADTDI